MPRIWKFAISDTSEIEVIDSGSITVSAKKLFEILKELTEDRVQFKLNENNWITVTCGMAQFKLVGVTDEDFPRMPEYDASILIPFPSDVLDVLTRKTSFAVQP